MRSTLLTTATLALLAIPGQASSIGVNFSAGSHTVLPTDNPGVVAGANWNNIAGGSGGPTLLQDDAAAATTASLSFTTAFQYAGFGTPATANAGTNTMYRGGIGGGGAATEAMITVTNIPYARYDVYVFSSADTSRTNQLTLTNGNTSYYYASAGASNTGAPSLLQTTSTTPGSPTTGQAQYQLFSGLDGPALTLTTGGSVSGILSNNVFGFHIVEFVAGQPALSEPLVESITATGAQASVILGESAAEVTLFWGTEDQATGTWPHSNPLGPQGIGVVNGAITGLSADTRYFYRFHAVNKTPDPDLEAWSGAATSFVTALTGKPVVNVAATAFGPLEIDVQWTDDFATETGFLIQRAPDAAGPWTTVARAPANSSFLTDAGSGLAPGTTYHYRVIATNPASDSEPSAVAEATTGPATPITTRVLVNFDGSLDGDTYTLGLGEIDSTASFKANGNPTLSGGLATINPGNGGGNQGFDFNPGSLDRLVSQNWVAEALLSFGSFAGLVATVLDVQGDSEFRVFSAGNMLETVYWNGKTDGRQLTSLPALGTPVHLALVWDASSYTMTGYVDGASIGPISQGPFVVPDATSVAFGYFGRTGFDNRGVDGVLDAVAFSSGTATFDPGSDFRILPPGTSYNTWIGGFALGGRNGFTDDPDGDLLSNGIEAFFGTDPGVGNTGPAAISTAGTTTTFTHPQAAAALNNVSGSYQWSPDLGTWYAGDGVDGPPGGPTVTILAATPVDGVVSVTATAGGPVARLFLRIVATN